jgi:hypothetical protein
METNEEKGRRNDEEDSINGGSEAGRGAPAGGGTYAGGAAVGSDTTQSDVGNVEMTNVGTTGSGDPNNPGARAVPGAAVSARGSDGNDDRNRRDEQAGTGIRPEMKAEGKTGSEGLAGGGRTGEGVSGTSTGGGTTSAETSSGETTGETAPTGRGTTGGTGAPGGNTSFETSTSAKHGTSPRDE